MCFVNFFFPVVSCLMWSWPCQQFLFSLRLENPLPHAHFGEILVLTVFIASFTNLPSRLRSFTESSTHLSRSFFLRVILKIHCIIYISFSNCYFPHNKYCSLLLKPKLWSNIARHNLKLDGINIIKSSDRRILWNQKNIWYYRNLYPYIPLILLSR